MFVPFICFASVTSPFFCTLSFSLFTPSSFLFFFVSSFSFVFLNPPFSISISISICGKHNKFLMRYYFDVRVVIANAARKRRWSTQHTVRGKEGKRYVRFVVVVVVVVVSSEIGTSRRTRLSPTFIPNLLRCFRLDHEGRTQRRIVVVICC